jgi:hypothetical protein
MHIQVLAKKHYGREVFEPISEDAKLLCNIAECKNLARWQLKLCKEAGYIPVVEYPKFNVDEL